MLHMIYCLFVCFFQNGKLATGILTPVVRDAGFSNVSEFLEKGTNDLAKCLQWKSPETDNNSIRYTSDYPLVFLQDLLQRLMFICFI